MIAYCIVIISLLLDGILTNYLPFLVNDLSYFTPLLTLTAIIIIYPFYRKKEEKYFITIFIIGIIYDLLYTNLLFFNGVLFVLIGFLIHQIQKRIALNWLVVLLEMIGMIFLYEATTGILLYIFNMVPITITKVCYKITHSLALNMIYGEGIYILLKIIPKKYKKISIN